MAEIFHGGRDAIKRNKDKVIRPTGPWSAAVHRYLHFLHENGLKNVPYPFDIDQEQREHVSYIEGLVFNSMEDEASRSDALLTSLAHYLREFHRIGIDYISELNDDEIWMLPRREPIETMCHGDLGPYNIVTKDNKVIGLIDFDTLHPGPILWDLAYGLYRWVPLMNPDNPENFGEDEDKLRRIKVFMTAYGLPSVSTEVILDRVIERVMALINYMLEQAKMSKSDFQAAIDRGDLVLYRKDIAYIREFKDNVIIT